MNILVVDDEHVQVETICRGLRRKGFRVTQAYNGGDALKKIQDDTGIDMVITDYAMPGMNGLDLLKKIREIHGSLPVIMMTAYGEKELVIEALKNRCDNFIEKPFTLDQLLTEADRALRTAPPSQNDERFSKTIPQHLHQINNPLMSIIGSAELAMLKANDSEAVRRSIRRILDAAKKITEINRKMLHSGSQTSEPTAEFDIGPVLERCLNMFNDLLILKGITLVKKLGHRQVKTAGNRFDLEQMIKNLILNAIEAMEGSTRKQLRIETYLESYAGRIVIHVHDSGCGIPEENLPTLFIPYFTSKPKGTGLGLPVVKRIVEKHGGKIRVKTRVGKGTVFTVKLPTVEEKKPSLQNS